MDIDNIIGHAGAMSAGSPYRGYTIVGWILTVIGCAFWAYGYFVRTSPALIDWPAFAPKWIADYLPNWPSEVGLMLTLAGSVAIYYAEIQSYRQTK